MAHTKGPWEAKQGNVGSDHPLFVTAPDMDGFRPWSDDDARLIAAAPELLECLKAAADKDWCTPKYTLADQDRWLKRAWKAIAKAEGK